MTFQFWKKKAHRNWGHPKDVYYTTHKCNRKSQKAKAWLVDFPMDQWVNQTKESASRVKVFSTIPNAYILSISILFRANSILFKSRLITWKDGDLLRPRYRHVPRLLVGGGFELSQAWPQAPTPPSIHPQDTIAIPSPHSLGLTRPQSSIWAA